MATKAISSETLARLNKLHDEKLVSLIDWLNHTGYTYAFERGGRLYHHVMVGIARNITEKKTFSTKRGEAGVEIEWVKL